MLTNLHKTPFPWFGGKADAAPLIWDGLGDVAHYVEPFAGSLAVLLRRPHEANRTYFSETVNDVDALLCNFWRALAADPEGVAEAASWPVSEADLFARHLALVNWRGVERLRADPEYYDAKMAGWWAWGQSCWIGSGWCSGRGAWVVGADGVVRKREREESGGVKSQRPHLGNDGQGVNRPQLREPGVDSKRPHLSHDGKGVNTAAVREPGVGEEPEYHPMTMPELRRWLRFLAARLRHVRILCGDWSRACTSGALKTLPVRSGKGKAGVFLDPPYGDVRDADLYAADSLTIAAEVRAWCLANGDDPDLRIVLAGFDEEHTELERHGWRVVEWYKAGFLKGGMSNTGKEKGNNQHRERLWFSPHCLQLQTKPAQPQQQSLF